MFHSIVIADVSHVKKMKINIWQTATCQVCPSGGTPETYTTPKYTLTNYRETPGVNLEPEKLRACYWLKPKGIRIKYTRKYSQRRYQNMDEGSQRTEFSSWSLIATFLTRLRTFEPKNITCQGNIKCNTLYVMT